MSVIGLAVSDNLSIDARASPPRVIVIFQDAQPGSLGQQHAAGAAIKGSVGAYIVAQGALIAVGNAQQDGWLDRAITSSGDEDFGLPTLDGAVGHAQSIQAPDNIVNRRFTVSQSAVTDGDLPHVRDLQARDGCVGA